MSRYIDKPVATEDFYIEWSSIVDCPTAWGTRAQMESIEWLDITPERFDRADESGSSSHFGHQFGDDDYLVRNHGPVDFLIEARNMRAFCLSMDPQNPDLFNAALTKPAPETITDEETTQ